MSAPAQLSLFSRTTRAAAALESSTSEAAALALTAPVSGLGEPALPESSPPDRCPRWPEHPRCGSFNAGAEKCEDCEAKTTAALERTEAAHLEALSWFAEVP